MKISKQDFTQTQSREGQKMKTLKQDFTLMELLVVIAIIAILASMLLPALNRSRENARSSTCLNQLKGLGAAAIMYETDYGYLLPGYRMGGLRTHWGICSAGASGENWQERLSPYLGGKSVWLPFPASQTTYSTAMIKSIWTCPSTELPISGGESKYGSKIGYWGPHTRMPLQSYGHNSDISNPKCTEDRLLKSNNIKNPSKYFLLTETNTSRIGPISWVAFYNKNGVRWRHGGKANVVYVAGNASSVKFFEYYYYDSTARAN